MEKFGVKNLFKIPADNLNEEKNYQKVLFDIKSGDIFFGKKHDGTIVTLSEYMGREKEIDKLTENLETDTEYDVSLLNCISK